MLQTILSQSSLSRVCHDPHVSPSLCRAYTGPCSATKNLINTLSAAGGEANEETLGFLTAGWLILIHTRKYVSSIKP